MVAKISWLRICLSNSYFRNYVKYFEKHIVKKLNKCFLELNLTYPILVCFHVTCTGEKLGEVYMTMINWFCQSCGCKYADVFSCNTNLQFPFCAVILSIFPLYTTYYGKIPLIQCHLIQRLWWSGSWEESSLRTGCFAFYQQKAS